MDLWSAYDEMGGDYESHAAGSAYNAHYDRPAVLAALGPVTGQRVVDAACGPGLYAESSLAAGAEVVGFDASQTMVDLARKRLGQRAQIDLVRLGEPLPYPGEAFDSDLCALAIHYVADRPAAFAELYRVLRAGAMLVVSTQHPTIDWLRKGGSYFDSVLETDTWHLPTGDVQIRFWREPLLQLCAAATSAGFLINHLIEPRPTERMRELFPHDYATLSQQPGFLILRLLKPR